MSVVSAGRGRTPARERVVLNVYDLSDNTALYPLGLGAYHSGLTVHGAEFTFASGAGVFSHPPGQAQGAVFREAVYLGDTSASASEVARIVAAMRPEWPGSRYNIIRWFVPARLCGAPRLCCATRLCCTVGPSAAWWVCAALWRSLVRRRCFRRSAATRSGCMLDLCGGRSAVPPLRVRPQCCAAAASAAACRRR
jgi:hypothetical protein